jgi:hypothetical protein
MYNIPFLRVDRLNKHHPDGYAVYYANLFMFVFNILLQVIWLLC